MLTFRNSSTQGFQKVGYMSRRWAALGGVTHQPVRVKLGTIKRGLARSVLWLAPVCSTDALLAYNWLERHTSQCCPSTLRVPKVECVPKLKWRRRSHCQCSSSTMQVFWWGGRVCHRCRLGCKFSPSESTEMTRTELCAPTKGRVGGCANWLDLWLLATGHLY